MKDNILTKETRRKFIRQEKGFFLMEVILSVFIIITALVGLLTLLVSVSSAGGSSSSKLVAAGLAQEGIEIVKSIRDINFTPGSWDNWYASILGTSNYLVQYDDIDFRAWQDLPLKYSLATGFYGYDEGENTALNFKRQIILTKNPSGADDNEIKVESVISWIEHNRPQSLIVEDRLWNWR